MSLFPIFSPLDPKAVSFSLTFDGSNDYAHYTPSAVGNNQKGTFSVWVLRGAIGSVMHLFNAGAGNDIFFNAANKLCFSESSGASYITNTAYASTTAWYHIVWTWDTALATAGNRLRLYVDGSEVTSFSTETHPARHDIFDFSGTARHTLGANEANGEKFNGKMAQPIYVDGGTGAASNFATDDLPITYAEDLAATQTIAVGQDVGTVIAKSGANRTAAPFDGTTPQAANASHYHSSTDTFSGKDFGSGNTKIISRFDVRGGSTYDLGHTDQSDAMGIKLQGSTDNFSSSVVDLLDSEITFTDGARGDPIRGQHVDVRSAFRYVRVVVRFVSINDVIVIAEITFDEEKPATTGYGINGFRLMFEDSSNLGTDSSANENNLTEVSLATSQQSTDTPFTE
jgi:hypothetical protein